MCPYGYIYTTLTKICRMAKMEGNMSKINITMKEAELLLECMRNKFKKSVYGIKAQNGKAGIFDSKFGGYPYWNSALDYPENFLGEKLLLLAQINFDKKEFQDDMLPSKGMLQFYIADDDLSGLEFDDQTIQNGFRIIYHENIDYGITEEDIKNMGVPAGTDGEHEYFPILSESGISFKKGEEGICSEIEGFKEAFNEAYVECTGKELPQGTDFWDLEKNEASEYLYEKLSGFGHKLLGYPAFTQSDPRDDTEEYDTLLLQIDSENNISIWGDWGICNFFINGEKLKNLDFSDVMYNWDCY